MPVGKNHDEGTAGPSFELYADVRLSTQVDNRFLIVLERLDGLVKETKDLAADTPRLAYLSTNLEWIGLNIRAVATESTA